MQNILTLLSESLTVNNLNHSATVAHDQ